MRHNHPAHCCCPQTVTPYQLCPECPLHGTAAQQDVGKAHEGEGDPRGWRDAVNPNP